MFIGQIIDFFYQENLINSKAKNKIKSKIEFTPVFVPLNGSYCKNMIIGK